MSVIPHFLRDVFSKCALATPPNALHYLYLKARKKPIEKSTKSEFHTGLRLAGPFGISEYVGGSDMVCAIETKPGRWTLYRSRFEVFESINNKSNRTRLLLPMFFFNKVAKGLSLEQKDAVMEFCKDKPWGAFILKELRGAIPQSP